MQEQLINFETAKLAKEKGFFDKNIYGEVRLSQQHYYGDKGILHNIREAFNEKDYDLKNCCNAPTQSLLQKWLREVHNIYVESYHDLTSDGKSIQFYTSWGFLQSRDINGNKNVDGWYDEYNDWVTYEEALEFGLQEALKMIKDE